MTWIERLQPEITLESPDGDVFTAAWRGNRRTLEKKVGVFDYPGVDGSVTQDLGAAAIIYPLTFYFDGPDNDIEAERFLTACKQRGPWRIDHPVKGRIELQLLSATEKSKPVASGNVTKFETEWIEPLIEKAALSTAEQGHDVTARVDDLNAASADQFAKNIAQNTASERWSVVSGVQNIMQAVSASIDKLYKPVAEINSQIASVRRSITDAISEVVVDVAGLAGQIQNLIQLPAMAAEDIRTRVSAYSDLLKNVYTFSPSADDPALPVRTSREVKNAAAVQELAMVSSLSALAVVSGSIGSANASASASADVRTRTDAVAVIDELADRHTEVINELDKIQQVLITKNINEQYFSQQECFSITACAMAAATAHVLSASHNLSAQRRIVLKKARTPVEIVIAEYGSLGENNERLDRFIAANALAGMDILLLRPGKEVVVYA
ncbi:MAG: hypothetical protein GY874_02670 [Desulfobacteraceae bacterium]|nr:hypothetical protein [Desulfobacteraceae bacterium]